MAAVREKATQAAKEEAVCPHCAQANADIVETDGGGCACCSGKMKERSEKEKKDLINRLSRIEGQIRGIKRMIDEDAYCIDVLRQSTAASAALNSFNKVILSRHIRTCVTENVKNGNEEVIDELVDTIQKLMK
ncbi:MAG: metal-sensing transcriptional repressor [Lachnospiraceae bacterium]|nr:metal-sensing transcriptional repressor [Lachnospiraceae bacterium]